MKSVQKPHNSSCVPQSLTECQTSASYNVSVDNPRLLQFSECWSSINNEQIGSGLARTGYLSRPYAIHALMELNFSDPSIFFNLDMHVTLAAGKSSDLQIYNTRVDANGCIDHYPLILRRISQCVPIGTELLTYVREPQTLNLLKDSYQSIIDTRDYEQLPLIKLFNSSGWQFVNLQRVETKDDLRAFPIRFKTIEVASRQGI